MGNTFKVIKQIECTVCHGAGRFEHPDGDFEFCTLCGRKGYWETEVTLDEAVQEVGATRTADKEVAAAMERAYYHFDNAPGDLPCASALLAIAEQLAVLNSTLMKRDR